MKRLPAPVIVIRVSLIAQDTLAGQSYHRMQAASRSRTEEAKAEETA